MTACKTTQGHWLLLGCMAAWMAGTSDDGGTRAALDGGSAGPPSDRRDVLAHGVYRKDSGRYARELCGPPGSHRLRCLANELLPQGWEPGQPISDAPVRSRLSAAVIDAAYGLPPTARANGKIVAILGPPDDHALADLRLYRAAQGLPPLKRCDGLPAGSGTACFAQVAQDGGASTNTDPHPGMDRETSLDMAMVSIACPDCSILLVEIAPTLCERDFVAGVATAKRLGASASSISFGGPEATDPNALGVGKGGGTNGTTACPEERSWTHDIAGPFSTPGHLVFAAAGDYGYDNHRLGFTDTVTGAATTYPASSPFVIAVGGTALYWTAAGTAEGVWNNTEFARASATTSGCSSQFAMPPWQAPLLRGSACKRRASADLAAMATFFVDGVEVGIDAVAHGRSFLTEGTSAAAPLVAAIFTRLGLTTAASNDLGWIYDNRAAFNDVGSSVYPLPPGALRTNAPAGATCGVLCTAGPGWDGPTGVGSPNGSKLLALPVSDAAPKPYPDAGVEEPDGLCAGIAQALRSRASVARFAWIAALGLTLVRARRRRASRPR